MPYSSNRDLPKDVKDVLPEHAQDIYRKAFNSAHNQYQEPDKRRGDSSLEKTSHKVAWNAVKQDYEKGDDDKWHKK